MPNRIVREAILSSERIASLGWAEEVFYRRLMSIVDDYGRTEANAQLLRARCYPLQTDQVRAADIARWMAACQKAGVILCYEVGGKQYLEVLNFGQQQRSTSKFPPPPTVDSNCEQAPSDAHLGVFVSEGVSEGVVGKTRKRATPQEPEVARPDDVSEPVWRDWVALRRKKRTTVSETAIEGARAEAAKAGITLEGFLRIWVTRGSQGMEASWIKPEERRQALSFAQIDQENRMTRWEQMTGQVHPDRQKPGGVVIDLPNSQLTIGARN